LPFVPAIAQQDRLTVQVDVLQAMEAGRISTNLFGGQESLPLRNQPEDAY
jgi:hypothetical protein